MFSLVSSRYERASMIVTSNKPFSAWGEIFGDDMAATAMIDRLIHHAEILSLKGDSYRLRGKELSLSGARVEPRAGGGADEDRPGAETGIVVAGQGEDGHGYVLEDATLRGTPAQWAVAAIAAYRRHQADRIVGEVNKGGDMVGYTLATIDPRVPFASVWASRGKYTRAEPVSALYARRRCHHVGVFPSSRNNSRRGCPASARRTAWMRSCGPSPRSFSAGRPGALVRARYCAH
jgi:hypothetical protein